MRHQLTSPRRVASRITPIDWAPHLATALAFVVLFFPPKVSMLLFAEEENPFEPPVRKVEKAPKKNETAKEVRPDADLKESEVEEDFRIICYAPDPQLGALSRFLRSGKPSKENPHPDDARVLELNLMVLNALRNGALAENTRDEKITSSSDNLAVLVRHSWFRTKGETPQDMFTRIKAEGVHVRRNYQELVKEFQQRPFGEEILLTPDWREQETFWLGLLETIEQAKQDQDPAAVFKRRLPASAEQATLYRLAYLHLIRFVGHGELDLELVHPLLETESDQVLIVRLLEILATFHSKLTEREQAAQQALKSRLDQALSRIESDVDLAYYLSRVNESNDGLLYELEDWILHTASAEAGFILVQALQPPPEFERELLLKRDVKFNFQKIPLANAVEKLCAEVHYPVWIDERIYKDQTPITLQASGSWLEVLDRTLAPTPYRARLLWSRVLWIGDLKDLPQAEQLIGRVPQVECQTNKALNEICFTEFIETPLGDVMDYLQDVHSVRIFMLESSEHPITLKSQSPLFAALTTFTKTARLDWYANEELIVVGTPGKLAAFRQEEDRRFRRELAPRGKMDEVLNSQTSFDFVETPLQDVVSYLCDAHDHRFIALGDQELPVTIQLRGVKLSTALSLLAIANNLAWDFDDTFVALGPPDQIARFKQLAADREARQKKLPAESYAKLRQPLTLEFWETPLKDVLKSLSHATTLKISISDSLDLRQPISLECKNLPLEIQLDLLQLKHDLQWSIEKETIRIDSRKKQAD